MRKFQDTFETLKRSFISALSIFMTVPFIKNCYFTIGNLVFKQDIGIPIGTDPAPFGANVFLYFFESKYLQNLISEKSTHKYHATSRFTDDPCAINDDDEFSKSFKRIY